MPKVGTEQRVLAPYLVQLIERNSYLRQPNEDRRKEEKTNYRKGWELRLVLDNESEVEAAVRSIASSGLKAGRPFKKWSRWVIPLYGREAVKLIQQEVDLRKTRA
jgi:hypothetical protein